MAISPSSALKSQFPFFSRWARGKAVGLRLDALAGVPREADPASIDWSDPAAALPALEAGLAQWRASPTRFSMVQELSRAVAAVEDSPEGSSFLFQSNSAYGQAMSLDSASARVLLAGPRRDDLDANGELTALDLRQADGQSSLFFAAMEPLDSVAELAQAAFTTHMGPLASAAAAFEKGTRGEINDDIRGAAFALENIWHGRHHSGRGSHGRQELYALIFFLRELGEGVFHTDAAQELASHAARALEGRNIQELSTGDIATIAAMPLFDPDFEGLHPSLLAKRERAMADIQGRETLRRTQAAIDYARPQAMKLRAQALGHGVEGGDFDPKSLREIGQAYSSEPMALANEAMLLARARIRHWVASHGVEGLEDEVAPRLLAGKAVDSDSLVRVMAQGKALLALGTAEGLTTALACSAIGARAHSAFDMAEWGLHGERLEAFAASTQGRSLCEMLLGSPAPNDRQRALAAAACLADFDESPGQPSAWAQNPQALAASALAASCARAEAGRIIRSAGLRLDPHRLADLAYGVASACAAMGGASGLEWSSARFAERSRQLLFAARQALGGTQPPEPSQAASDSPAMPGFPPLESAWSREAEPTAAPAPDADPAAAALDGLGNTFEAHMARLAWAAGRRPDMAELGKADHALENALKSQAKSAARRWLGLSDAAWRGSRDADAGEVEGLLRAAKKASAPERKAAAAADAAERPSESLDERVTKAAYNAAFGSGRTALHAEIAAAGLLSWSNACLMESVGHPAGADADSCSRRQASTGFLRALLSPVESGASIQAALAAGGRELAARSERWDRFEMAALERAQALLAEELAKETAKPTKKANLKSTPSALAAKRAKTRLATELSDMADWANDQPGNFWSQLPRKFGWAELRAGSARWHEEAAGREAGKGLGWAPIGLSWLDEKAGLRAQELCSPTLLAAEGKAMRHCVGSYSNQCQNGTRIVSIRQGERPVATLQLEPEGSKWRQAQLKGACNAEPTRAAKAAAALILAEANAISKMAHARAAAAAEAPMPKARSLEPLGFDADAELRAIQSTAPKARA